MKNNMKFKEKSKDTLYVKLNIISAIATAFVLSFLSVGFALYTQVVNITGIVGVLPQGEFGITSVTRTASQNTDNGLPTFTADTVDFNLTFVKSDDPDPVYTATYDIEFTNDTFYDQTISDLGLSFTINDQNGNPLGTINYTVTGVDSGGMVPKLSSAIATVDIEFIPLVDQNTYVINGEAEVASNEKPQGNLLASLNNNTGDIRNGALAQFSINVVSTYENPVTFNIVPVSPKVIICDSNGNNLSSQTISANNSGQNYTFYIKADPNATFPDDTLTTSIFLTSTGLPNTQCGSVTLDVDKAAQYTDITPPTVGNLQATISDTVGEVDLTWTGSDDYSGVASYTILVLDSNGNVINTIDTHSDNTSYTVTGLSQGAVATTYSFKVYGTDNATPANTASQTDIDNASTSSGPCVATSQASYQWVYTVTGNISNGSYSGPTTVNRNQPLTGGTINANNNYDRPSSVTVTMGGQSTTAFSYNSNSGAFSMTKVTGNVVITGTCNYNWCLAEGTKILLANGKYKNIEDINYKDLLSVWSYDTGSIDYEYPIWIEKKKESKIYRISTFSDGTTLKTIGYHGIFSVDLNRFVSVDNPEEYYIGTRIYKVENNKLKEVTVTNIEIKEEPINHYHVVSSRYYNVIANDILTTDGTVILSNLYGFDKNVTWPAIKDVLLSDKNNLYRYDELKDALPKYMFIGMRAEEGKILSNYGLSLDMFKGYLKENQSKEGKYLEVDRNSNNKRLFMVTTSNDKVTNKNRNKYLKEENSYYTLPKNLKVKCYLNSIDKKCYSPGERVQVTTPIHFIAINK